MAMKKNNTYPHGFLVINSTVMNIHDHQGHNSRENFQVDYFPHLLVGDSF